jgi:hypothetical protein
MIEKSERTKETTSRTKEESIKKKLLVKRTL